MRLTAVQQIQNLILDEASSGIPLSDSIAISSDERTRLEIASDPNMRHGFGAIYMGTIAKARAIAFTRQDYSDSPQHALVTFPRIFIAHVIHFFIALWLIKDNSGNGSPVCIGLVDGGEAVGSIQGHDSMSLTAGCTLEEVTFSRAEVELALRYYRQIDALIPKVKADPRSPSATGVSDKSRVTRALFLVQAARNAGDVGLKSAFYCICLESLFSTATTEVSHRVSERTASFLGTDGAGRRAIYKDIHDLYDVRSPVVHGGSIRESRLPMYIELLKRCDGHLRGCLRRILDSPEMLQLFSNTDNGPLTAYFLRELFPDTP